MNSWSRTRKRLILIILFVLLIVLVGVPAFFLFRTRPTCSDGVQNGDETGIDCGGGCQKLCQIESLPILTHGDPRVLMVATSTYEVAALLENPNQARIAHARYTISLYSEGSLVPLRTIDGETYVPQASQFVLFEGPFDFQNEAVPVRATVEWDQSSLVWEKESQSLPQLTVGQTQFTRLDTAPRLQAAVKNASPEQVQNIDLGTLLFDKDGNIMAASKTFLDSLEAGETKQAIFTWPRPFAQTPVEVKVFPVILPDRTYLR